MSSLKRKCFTLLKKQRTKPFVQHMIVTTNEGQLTGGKAVSLSHQESANSLDSKNLTSLISTKLYLISNVFTTILEKNG
jgi:hypothetical protein